MLSCLVFIADKTSAVPTEVYWVALILLAIIIVVLAITLHKCTKNHGQYRFVPNNANDCSNGSIRMSDVSESGKI